MVLAGAIHFSQLHFFTCSTSKMQASIITGPEIIAVFPQKPEIFTQAKMDLQDHVVLLFGPVVIYLTDST